MPRLLDRLRPLASTTGALLTTPWPLLVALSFATTCTQGDDDSWAVTLVLCTMLTVLAVPLLLAFPRRSARSPWRLAVPVLTLGPLLLTLGHWHEIGFGAHHLCGAAYDYVLPYGSERLARWYYPQMWAMALALSAAALIPWLRPVPPRPTEA